MSDDVEKPLTGADAEAQPTKPSPAEYEPTGRVEDANPSTLSGPDAVQEDVGAIQGTPGGVHDGTNANVQVPPVAGRAPQPHVGGGEIEWSELGRQRPTDRLPGGQA